MAYTKQNFQDGQILYASGLNNMDNELVRLGTDKVNNADIINNLTSTDATKPLSAAQGKVLNDDKVNKTDIVNNLTSTNTDKPLSAAQGKILNENFNTSNTEIRNDISKLTGDLVNITTATSDDVGKALKAKTVTDGKVTEWEFDDIGSSVPEDVLRYREEVITLNPWGNGGCTLSEDGSLLSVKTFIEGGSEVYFFKNNNGSIGTGFPIDADCFDINGNKLQTKIYAWANPVKIPDGTAYIIESIKRTKVVNSINMFSGIPEIISYKSDETEVYAIAETKTNKYGTEKVSEAVKNSVDVPDAIYDTYTNYFNDTGKATINVKGGDVIRTNLFGVNITEWVYESEKWNDSTSYTGIKLNGEITGNPPSEAVFTVPRYIDHVTVNFNSTYPNTSQSVWYPIDNPYLTVNCEVNDSLHQGETILFRPKIDTALNNKIKSDVEEYFENVGVVSPLHGKKWMVFGDSTSCYAGLENSYPAFVANRTGCIVTNKAMAGSRITDNESSGTPIVNIVENNLTSDMEVLTLVGGYNDRRSYNASNPDWTWLGEMLDSDGNLNMNKTTFYGALNTIASKWFEVCPSATKAFFTIFPCGMNPNGEYETRINAIIKEVANYWCIPCFDAWNEVGLPVRLDYINQTYYMGDRIHPNTAGGEFISRYVQAKLESIMS